jgi:hypothetical protein
MANPKKILIGGGAILIAAIVAGAALWLSITQDGRFRPLTTADRYEVFSIDSTGVNNIKKLEDCKILGSTVVTDAKMRDTLNAALIDGVKYAPEPAQCFTPRHAIRVTKSGAVIDFLICFECGRIHVQRGSKDTEIWIVSRTPEAAFDKVLTDARVKLAAKSK